ncbi:MAG: FAD-binding oxidoreductase [Chloroflexi bacterium]|nr:MAG: FAD-binding oxidoreductase [Chloroflexota bacterium]
MSLGSADAVIVGGGVVGCSIAYHLARRGAKVLLVERDTLGSQSTGKCAGGVRRQFSSETNVLMQQLSIQLLAGLEAETGVDPEFRQIGYLFLVTNSDQVDDFKRLLSMWLRLGVSDARWVEPSEIRELAPVVRGDDILGGTFCPTDGIASPHAVTSGYASAARRLGVKILEGVAVTGIDVHQARISAVTTSAGDIATPAVFNCAGAWAGEVGKMAGLSVPVEPYPRNIFVTDRMPAVTRDHPMTIDMTTSFYFHPEGEGLLFGMGRSNETPSFDTQVDWSMLDAMAEVVERRAPSLGTAGVRTAWAGLYEMTPDHQPILGPVDGLDGFWCACGFSGHGFQQAPAVGHLLARCFLGEKPEVSLDVYAHRRFKTGVVEPERNVI